MKNSSLNLIKNSSSSSHFTSRYLPNQSMKKNSWCGLFHIKSTTMAENKAVLEVQQGNSQFATHLYKVLSQEEENIFFSPISIHAILSMAYQGAQGTTAEHFASALQVSQAEIVAEGYKKVMKELNSAKNVTLLMANKIFLMEGLKMLKDFKTAITKCFRSEVQQVNFDKNVEAAKTINAWVEKQTHHKIKDVISEGELNNLTRLVLVNAIYFKGDWLYKFNKDATKTAPFYLNDVETVDVEMMHIEWDFCYKDDTSLNAKVLQMPYTNQDLNMTIILPNERNGISDLEQQLAKINLADITGGMRTTKVDVSLPKFKIEQTIDLKGPLTELGLGEIFDKTKANFRGMIELGPDENLYVDKAIQKTFIEVNEEGTEAAAISVYDMMDDMYVETQYFSADHPFIFFLIQKETVLFMGKIVQV